MRECTGVNGEALQVHAVDKTCLFCYKSNNIYHHSTKPEISRVRCHLYCYKYAALVCEQQQTSDIFYGIAWYYGDYHTNPRFHWTVRRSARDLYYLIRILA